MDRKQRQHWNALIEQALTWRNPAAVTHLLDQILSTQVLAGEAHNPWHQRRAQSWQLPPLPTANPPRKTTLPGTFAEALIQSCISEIIDWQEDCEGIVRPEPREYRYLGRNRHVISKMTYDLAKMLPRLWLKSPPVRGPSEEQQRWAPMQLGLTHADSQVKSQAHVLLGMMYQSFDVCDEDSSQFHKLYCKYSSPYRENNQEFLKGATQAVAPRQGYTLALTAYNRALELDPHNGMAYRAKALLLHAHGQTQEALACWRQAIHYGVASAGTEYVRALQAQRVASGSEATVESLSAEEQAILNDAAKAGCPEARLWHIHVHERGPQKRQLLQDLVSDTGYFQAQLDLIYHDAYDSEPPNYVAAVKASRRLVLGRFKSISVQAHEVYNCYEVTQAEELHQHVFEQILKGKRLSAREAAIVAYHQHIHVHGFLFSEMYQEPWKNHLKYYTYPRDDQAKYYTETLWPSWRTISEPGLGYEGWRKRWLPALTSHYRAQPDVILQELFEDDLLPETWRCYLYGELCGLPQQPTKNHISINTHRKIAQHWFAWEVHQFDVAALWAGKDAWRQCMQTVVEVHKGLESYQDWAWLGEMIKKAQLMKHRDRLPKAIELLQIMRDELGMPAAGKVYCNYWISTLQAQLGELALAREAARQIPADLLLSSKLLEQVATTFWMGTGGTANEFSKPALNGLVEALPYLLKVGKARRDYRDVDRYLQEIAPTATITPQKRGQVYHFIVQLQKKLQDCMLPVSSSDPDERALILSLNASTREDLLQRMHQQYIPELLHGSAELGMLQQQATLDLQREWLQWPIKVLKHQRAQALKSGGAKAALPLLESAEKELAEWLKTTPNIDVEQYHERVQQIVTNTILPHCHHRHLILTYTSRILLNLLITCLPPMRFLFKDYIERTNGTHRSYYCGFFTRSAVAAEQLLQQVKTKVALPEVTVTAATSPERTNPH